MKPFVLFVGSAISGFEPSIMPTVPEVKSGIISSIDKQLSGLTSNHIKSVLRQFKEKNSKISRSYNRIAFEALIEIVYETNPNSAVNLLSLYSSKKVNKIHEAISKLIIEKNIPVIYTTNFDECLEFALEMKIGGKKEITKITKDHPATIIAYPELSPFKIVKIHGTISRLKKKEDIEELIARYKDVAKPLPDEITKMIIDDLCCFDFKFIGYGGIDFDINAVFSKYDNKHRSVKHQWYDYTGEKSIPKNEYDAVKKQKERTKTLIGTETKYIDLSIKNNELFESAKFDLKRNLKLSTNNIELIVRKIKLDRKGALELLGRILDYIQAPQSREVLLKASEKYKGKKLIDFKLISLNGLMHEAKDKEFVYSALSFLSKSQELEENQIVKLLSDIALASVLSKLPVPLIISHFLLLIKLFWHTISFQDDKEYHLYAKRILLHNFQRFFLLIPPKINYFMKKFSKNQFKFSEKIKREGLLREFAYIQREGFKAKSRSLLLLRKSKRNDEDYKKIIKEMSDLELFLSVMGAETGAVNVLRDMAEISLFMDKLSKAEKFAEESKRSANLLVGHERDVKKANKILKSITFLKIKKMSFPRPPRPTGYFRSMVGPRAGI